jgi:hypothetical protein
MMGGETRPGARWCVDSFSENIRAPAPPAELHLHQAAVEATRPARLPAYRIAPVQPAFPPRFESGRGHRRHEKRCGRRRGTASCTVVRASPLGRVVCLHAAPAELPRHTTTCTVRARPPWRHRHVPRLHCWPCRGAPFSVRATVR